MSSKETKGTGTPSLPPRRTRYEKDNPSNTGIYLRADGKLEIGFRDSAGKLRWRGPFDTVTQARAERDRVRGARASGQVVMPNPRLRFGEASDRWLAEQVSDLRPATRRVYESAVRVHLKERWGGRRLDAISTDDAAQLTRELRESGLSEWTISGILKAANRVFKFARRRMAWHGANPLVDLENGERARPSQTGRRRLFSAEELTATIGAATGRWKVLFALLATTGCRLSEALGLIWSDVDLRDREVASVSFEYQVDLKGQRMPLKTDESRRIVELPPSLAAMLMEHRAATPYSRDDAFVFCSRSGRPLGQRNVLRALRATQKRAKTIDGRWAFGVMHEDGPVPTGSLPDLHAFRHSAASEAISAGESVEQVSWQLGHRNSQTTRQIYLQEVRSVERSARRRAAMEDRYGAALGAGPPEQNGGEVVSLDEARESGL